MAEKMTQRKVDVLRFLLRRGSSTVKEVTSEVGNTSCRFLKELTAAGYVSKTLAADGRRIVHAVTAKVPEDLSTLLPPPSERKARVVHVPTRERYGACELSCELAWVVRDAAGRVVGARVDKTDALDLANEANSPPEGLSSSKEAPTPVVVPSATRLRSAKARANA